MSFASPEDRPGDRVELGWAAGVDVLLHRASHPVRSRSLQRFAALARRRVRFLPLALPRAPLLGRPVALVAADGAERAVERSSREREWCQERELVPEQRELVVADTAQSIPAAWRSAARRFARRQGRRAGTARSAVSCPARRAPTRRESRRRRRSGSARAEAATWSTPFRRGITVALPTRSGGASSSAGSSSVAFVVNQSTSTSRSRRAVAGGPQPRTRREQRSRPRVGRGSGLAIAGRISKTTSAAGVRASAAPTEAADPARAQDGVADAATISRAGLPLSGSERLGVDVTEITAVRGGPLSRARRRLSLPAAPPSPRAVLVLLVLAFLLGGVLSALLFVGVWRHTAADADRAEPTSPHGPDAAGHPRPPRTCGDRARGRARYGREGPCGAKPRGRRAGTPPSRE